MLRRRELPVAVSRRRAATCASIVAKLLVVSMTACGVLPPLDPASSEAGGAVQAPDAMGVAAREADAGRHEAPQSLDAQSLDATRSPADAEDASASTDARPSSADGRPEAGSPVQQVADAQPAQDAGPSEAASGADVGASVTDASTDPAARDQLDWVLAAVRSGQALPGEDVTQHFAPAFLAQVPEAQVLTVFAELHDQLGSFTVLELGQTADGSLRATLDAAGNRWTVDLQVASSAPHQIVLLLFNPLIEAPVFPTYDAAFEQLRQLAASPQLLVAEIDGTTCAARESYQAADPLAIGSAFKLWVLLALDSKLRADPTLTWDAQLAIQDELKSAPSGVLQNEPAGTPLSLHEFAAKMISISDNTAADHLLAFIGREAVERAQLDAQHSAPDRNIPWLYTRELFALKAWASPFQVAAYRQASVADKRALLDQLRALPIDLDKLAAWTTPRSLDLEWFATPLDLCRVLALLGARADWDTDAPLLSLLALNPGAQFDADAWSYIGYKGGSEPGVLDMSWLLRRADGRWFSLVITLNDEVNLIDQDAAVHVAAGIAQLLSAQD